MLITKKELLKIHFIASRERYEIKLIIKEAGILYSLLYILQQEFRSDELEVLIMEELKNILYKKYEGDAKKLKIKLTPAQARTLFSWLSRVISFPHPLQTDLAARIVDQLYKQII